MLRIDLVDWIAPDVVAGVASTSTFRDASIVLPWLEYSHVRLPPWDGQQIEVSLVFPKILTSLASFPGGSAPPSLCMLWKPCSCRLSCHWCYGWASYSLAVV